MDRPALRFDRINHAWCGTALRALVVLLLAAATNIDVASAQQDEKPASFERRIYDCFSHNDYKRAVELIEEHLKQSPNDAGMLYNLACAKCLLKDNDGAASALLRAFQAGFDDIAHLRSDPDLSGLRSDPVYRKILEAADRAAGEAARPAVDRWRDAYGTKNYRYETDDERRINYATALDSVSHKEMREMLEREEDHLVSTLFESPPSYFVLIAVPTPDDADKFFNGNDAIGGMYQHQLRRLVSRDIGGSLRHEFFHAMHFGHMERIGQPHPLWIQEGLACLYEDYELKDDGSIRFLPNDRQIVAKNRAKTGLLIKWNELFKMSAEEFMDKPQQMYPQVRSIFEFVADRGKLPEWYRTYVQHFSEDRTGAKAFELTFAKPLAEVEKDWRKWLIAQPMIDLQIREGDAALGIRSRENASNDGVLITDVLPGSSAAVAKLRRGDVVVAVDGQSTRSLVDLRRIIAVKSVGDEVEIKARRTGDYFTVRVRLKAIAGRT